MLLLLLLMLLPFLGASLYLLVPRHRLPLTAPRLLALVTTAFSLLILTHLTLERGNGEEVIFFAEWIPSLGLNVSLWLDGPALFFAWIVLGIGFLIFWYSGYYLEPDDAPWRFYGTMVFFMGSMLGVVISRNLLMMLVFWELTSISSFLLIGHWHQKASARQGALRALVVTASGGLCLIAGIAGLFWLGLRAGLPAATALEWDVLWANREALMEAGSGLATTSMILLLIGAFTKSAQFPFQFWLPGAMEAPTPVSAFLHAATMVKAGIYLLGRLYPLFWEHDLWLAIVGSVGCITMLIGGFMALMSRDLKQLLAHSTVSQLGLLTAYYGFGFQMLAEEKKLPLDLLLIASHAFFKGGLFMMIGVIDHGTHTRDWTRLGGLRKTMPYTAVLTALGSASMAGVPLTLGFVAKELFLKAALDLQTQTAALRYGLPVLAILASLFTVAYSLRLAISPFFGKPRDPSIHPHEGSAGLLAAPAILIVLCIAGAYVPLIEGPISRLVHPEFYGTVSGFHFAFFHHIDILLGIAVFLFTVGTGVFLAGTALERAYRNAGEPAVFRRGYELLFEEWIPKFAKALESTVQPVSLQRNMLVVITGSTGLLLLAAVLAGWQPFRDIRTHEIHFPALIVILLTAACITVMLYHRVLVIRLIAFVPVGLFVALFFLFFKAPDLALTQVTVELVLLIVLLLLLFRFPQRLERRTAPSRIFVHGGIAAVVGLFMAGLAYAGINSEYRSQPTLEGFPSVKDYYLQNSKVPLLGVEGTPEELALYPGADNPRSAGGKNAVNVVLVDFRSLDTIGEVAVLGIAALGVVMLLTLGRRKEVEADYWADVVRERWEELSRRRHALHRSFEYTLTGKATWPSPSLLLSELSRIVPTFLIVLSIVLLFAGHNSPGGGFIAGLLASAGLSLLLLSFRHERVARLHRRRYVSLVPWGILLAGGTGLVAVALGFPFLTTAYTYIDIPLVGEVEVASAMPFDAGVFLVVVGATMAIIELFGRD